MKIRPSLRIPSVIIVVCTLVALVAGYLFNPTFTFEGSEWLYSTGALVGIGTLIMLPCAAIPFAKVDEKGFWRWNNGLRLTRPLRAGERFAIADDRLWIQLADGEWERVRLPRWQTSPKTWARLEAEYPASVRDAVSKD